MKIRVKHAKAYPGFLIIFEGIDGAGKSECLQKVNEKLKSENYDVVCFREPSNGVFGKQIREKALSGELPPAEILADLFVKDRAENKRDNLLPSLETGKIVLLDRYFYSSLAYQGTILSPDYILTLNEDVILNPDLVLIFDIDVDTALARIQKNRNEITGFEKKEYLEKVKAIYDSFEASNIERVDAHQNFVKVYTSVCDIIINRIRYNY